ncbi:uncharacterized protein [Dermacentor albipictus]|uniref:uncharacterized protein isoform X2 n=1 Tax=Dermacentor albipictus TaxID=60249 RepID=UPI0031FC37BB
MTLFSPNDHFSDKHMAFRTQVLACNGVHFLYTMGRDTALPAINNVPGYSGLEVILLGVRIKDVPGKLGIQCTVSQSQLAAIEIDGSVLRSANSNGKVLLRPYDSVTIKERDNFSISLKCVAERDHYFHNCYYDIKFNQVKIPYITFDITTHMDASNFIILSSHIIDRSGARLPSKTNPLEYFLKGGWCRMSVGAFASCQATYRPSDAVRVTSATAVEDLGKPSDPEFTFTVRRTIDSFVFLTDYGKALALTVGSVLNKLDDDDLMPQFSDNVGLKRVVLTTMF